MDMATEDYREEQREIFAERISDIKSNEELSDKEKERAIRECEYELNNLEQSWYEQDLQQQEGITREFISD